MAQDAEAVVKTQLHKHPFDRDWDVPADHLGRPYCSCGARRDHERHTLPEMTAEQRARDAAVLGESETE